MKRAEVPLGSVHNPTSTEHYSNPINILSNSLSDITTNMCEYDKKGTTWKCGCRERPLPRRVGDQCDIAKENAWKLDCPPYYNVYMYSDCPQCIENANEIQRIAAEEREKKRNRTT